MFFQDLSTRRGFPRSTAEIIHNYGATMVISQELWTWRQRDPEDRSWLERITRGDYDTYWRDWAVGAKDFQERIVLRFGFEMNGDWFAWGQQPEAFIKAWRRIHQLVRVEVGAMNVEFMFSPNIEWDPNKPLTAIELYYPGDAYVQLLGLDGYNFGEDHSQWHRWLSFAEIFELSITKMSQWPQPLYLAEIGSAHGTDKDKWMENFLQTFQNDDRLHGFIYYNHADSRKKEPDWRIQSDPETLEVFRKYLKPSKE